MNGSASSPALLTVDNLTVRFRLRRASLTAVDDVSFSLQAGVTLGLVGESGAGKSTVAYAIMRLIEAPGEIVSGRIEFEGQDLMNLSERELEQIRRNRICMIFQDPMTTLNPVYRVGDQISEGLILHRGVSRSEARERTVGALREAGIPSPELRASAYPHQLSGGMQQRAIIAAGIALEPALIIADEPTTALDATIQAQILDLLGELIIRRSTSLILVSHNLAVVAEMADRIAVMYAGRVVEVSEKNAMLDGALHPYTLGLLKSVPSTTQVSARIKQIPGVMPSLQDLPTGCSFRPRCEFCRTPECLETPPLREVSPGRWVACHFPRG